MRKASLIKIMLCMTLLFGLISLFTVDTAEAKTARTAVVEEVTGTVHVKKAGGTKTYRAYKNMTLNYGDHIRTENDSSIVIKVVDREDEITIGSNAELLISDLKEDEQGNKKSKFKAWAGSIWAKASSLLGLDDEFEIETPTAIMGVRGTNFFIGIDPDTGDSFIAVFSGIVNSMRQSNDMMSSDDDVSSDDRTLLHPSQMAVIYPGMSDEEASDVFTILDLDEFANTVDHDVIEALLRNKSIIDEENEQYINSAREAMRHGGGVNFGFDLSEIDRIQQNLDNVISNIINKAVERDRISEDELSSIIDNIRETVDPSFELNRDVPPFEVSEEERARQEALRRAQEERRQAQQREMEERQRKQEQQLELLERLQRERERQQEANQAAAEQRKREAEERYRQQLEEQQRQQLEERLSERDKEKEQQEQRRQDRTAPPAPTPPPSSGGGNSGGGSPSPTLNFTALNELLQQAVNIEPTFYTSISYASFAEAKSYAQNVVQTAISQLQITEAYEALTNAMNGLEGRTIEEFDQQTFVQRYELGVLEEDIVLIDKISAIMSDGDTALVNVDWEWSEYNEPIDFVEGGEYVYHGTVEGFEGGSEFVLRVIIANLKEFSGKLSLPNGELAPAGGLEVKLAITHDIDWEELTVVIPEGENYGVFTTQLVECIENCGDYDAISYEILYNRHAQVDYLRTGYLSSVGSTSYWRETQSFADTALNLQNINFELMKGHVISGKIMLALPVQEDVEIDVNVYSNSGNNLYFAESYVIPEGQNSVPYHIRVVPDDNYEVTMHMNLGDGYGHNLVYPDLVEASFGDQSGINFPAADPIENLTIDISGQSIHLLWGEYDLGHNDYSMEIYVNGEYFTEESLGVDGYYIEHLETDRKYVIELKLVDKSNPNEVVIIEHAMFTINLLDYFELEFMLLIVFNIVGEQFEYCSEEIEFAALCVAIQQVENLIQHATQQSEIDAAAQLLEQALEQLDLMTPVFVSIDPMTYEGIIQVSLQVFNKYEMPLFNLTASDVELEGFGTLDHLMGPISIYSNQGVSGEFKEDVEFPGHYSFTLQYNDEQGSGVISTNVKILGVTVAENVLFVFDEDGLPDPNHEASYMYNVITEEAIELNLSDLYDMGGNQLTDLSIHDIYFMGSSFELIGASSGQFSLMGGYYPGDYVIVYHGNHYDDVMELFIRGVSFGSHFFQLPEGVYDPLNGRIELDGSFFNLAVVDEPYKVEVSFIEDETEVNYEAMLFDWMDDGSMLMYIPQINNEYIFQHGTEYKVLLYNDIDQVYKTFTFTYIQLPEDIYFSFSFYDAINDSLQLHFDEEIDSITSSKVNGHHFDTNNIVVNGNQVTLNNLSNYIQGFNDVFIELNGANYSFYFDGENIFY